MKDVIFSKYSNDRNEHYKIRTDILKDEQGRRYAVKRAISEQSKKHIENMYKMCTEMKKQFEDTIFFPNEGVLAGDSLELEYVEGKSLESVLNDLLEANEYEKFSRLIRTYVDEIKKSETEEFVQSEQYFEVFGTEADTDKIEKSMRVSDIDMIFSNIMVLKDKWIIMDYEWTFRMSIPLNYILYRTAHYYTVHVSSQLLNGINIYELFGIPSNKLGIYEKMERHFQEYVFRGNKPLWELYKEQGKESYFAEKIIADKINKNKFKRVQVFKDFGNGFENIDEFMTVEPNEEGNIILDVEIEPHIKMIRIDPAERKCVIHVNEIKGMADDEYDISYSSNGISVDNKTICFDNDDPQIWLGNLGENLKKLHINFSIEYMNDSMTGFYCKTIDNYNNMIKSNQEQEVVIRSLNQQLEKADIESKQELNAMRDELELMRRAYAEKDKVLEGILQSKSWKVTRVFRRPRK